MRASAIFLVAMISLSAATGGCEKNEQPTPSATATQANSSAGTADAGSMTGAQDAADQERAPATASPTATEATTGQANDSATPKVTTSTPPKTTDPATPKAGDSTAPKSGDSTPEPTTKATAAVAKPPFTAENNPTTLAGRGEPSLEDHRRPAAWVYIDEKPGAYREENGNQLLQWFTVSPVSSTPTIRVEYFKPLIENATEFAFALEPVPKNGAGPTGAKSYDVSAKNGTFKFGKVYSLCAPGEDFIIHERRNPENLTEIPPLPPGTYLIAASIKTGPNAAGGALGVTFFTVAAPKGE